MIKQARDIKAGDLFPSPREDEGTVRALENYGACIMDDRPDSVLVESLRWRTTFFIALASSENLHICDNDFCWADNPEVNTEDLAPWRDETSAPHALANVHAH